ncbi:MAG: hypothetical protein ABWY82_21660 [Tardiphaga sp.]
MDGGFQLIEHAVDDAGKARERFIDIPVRQPFAQISGDDALDPQIDFLDASLRANAEPRTRQQPEAERRQQPERERASDNPRDLPGLVDIAPNHQYIAVIDGPRDGPHQRSVGLIFVGPRHPYALHPGPGRKTARQARDIAGQPASLCIEETGEMNAAGILPEMIVERTDPAIGRQGGKEVDLRRDHAIGTRDQVTVDLEVDEGEQDRDKGREQGGQRGGPVKRVRAYELHLLLRTLPPGYLAGRAHVRHARQEQFCLSMIFRKTGIHFSGSCPRTRREE